MNRNRIIFFRSAFAELIQQWRCQREIEKRKENEKILIENILKQSFHKEKEGNKRITLSKDRKKS